MHPLSWLNHEFIIKSLSSIIRSMKAKIVATYPDAFPDESTIEALDKRPDLELPQ